MKKIVIGILAHVDAGKTTLSESMLYLSGKIRQLGRVDHGDTFLDYDMQERKRGITIFSKQILFSWKDTEFIFIDTPGHTDFSSEMERTLQVLDYAIVVINGLDGIQSHTQTIWHLLQHYQVPTFLFVNKMDISPYSSLELIHDIQQRLSPKCIDFTQKQPQLYESIALLDDILLEEYMLHQKIEKQKISTFIQNRQLFPTYFGSALKNQNVSFFLDGLNTYTLAPLYPQDFGARVYKVSYENGQCLTHIKITGGSLKVKDTLENNQKIDQIRIYSGHKYELQDNALSGDIVALKGIKSMLPGSGLGFEKSLTPPVLSAYMNYRIVLPDDCDHHQMLNHLKQLSQEDPSLNFSYQSSTNEMRIQLMGEIQIEILKNLIKERFHVDVYFDQGKILYKETIQDTVEGVGHFEPLRHYAEVHLLLEPGANGSGLVFDNQCSDENLSRQYQNLILTHLQEKEHIGVLTGSPITDIKITLLNGRAHQKHTEGGDFREATYRAVRQGLKMASSQLLEPYYHFHLEIPNSCLSRALYDIEAMNGTFQEPEIIGENVMIEGDAPVATMQNYQQQVISYSHGKGRLYCTLKGYQPSHNSDEVIKERLYDSESDLQNPTGSIFCQHGAGFYVNWDQVYQHMHIKNIKRAIEHQSSILSSENDDLETIFTRTYGPVKRRLADDYYHKEPIQESMTVLMKPECMLIDGYNVIFSWPDLKALAEFHLDVARERLIDILSNYQGYKQCLMIIVFDAYKMKENLGTRETRQNVHIIYTKEAQTADMYIERVTHQLTQEYNVTVATSDALEQTIVIGRGARRMSSRELKEEVEMLKTERFLEFQRKQTKNRNYLLEEVKDYKEDK